MLVVSQCLPFYIVFPGPWHTALYKWKKINNVKCFFLCSLCWMWEKCQALQLILNQKHVNWRFQTPQPISTTLVDSSSVATDPCLSLAIGDGGCTGQEWHQQNQDHPCTSFHLMKRRTRYQGKVPTESLHITTWAFMLDTSDPLWLWRMSPNAKHEKSYHAAAACDVPGTVNSGIFM